MTRISAGAATIATTGGRINVISGKERRAGSFPARYSSVKIKVDRDSAAMLWSACARGVPNCAA